MKNGDTVCVCVNEARNADIIRLNVFINVNPCSSKSPVYDSSHARETIPTKFQKIETMVYLELQTIYYPRRPAALQSAMTVTN